MKWYAVHTNVRSEKLVSEGLEKRGYATLFLHYRQIVRHGRSRREAIRGWYPRYVFVGLEDDQGLYTVSKTEGVAGIVHGGDGPLLIPAGIIDAERKRGDENGRIYLPHDDKLKRVLFERGEEVRLLGGAWAGLLATVELDTGSALRIWLNGFQGRVRAEVAPEGAEPASPERRRIQAA